MNADTWQQFGGILLLLALGAYNSWQTVKGRKQAATAADRADTAATRAGVAARQTLNTGNGYAERTEAALASIAEKVDETNKLATKTHDLMTEHLADHAGSDLTARVAPMRRR